MQTHSVNDSLNVIRSVVRPLVTEMILLFNGRILVIRHIISIMWYKYIIIKIYLLVAVYTENSIEHHKFCRISDLLHGPCVNRVCAKKAKNNTIIIYQ